MGCDIHLFAEKKRKRSFAGLLLKRNTKWENIDKWTKNKCHESDPDEPEYIRKDEDKFYSERRNYNLFCALCGVRKRHFKGNPNSISDPKGLPSDVSDVVKKESDRLGSDGHSHSWNTLKELKEFDWSEYGETVSAFLDEVIPKMEAQRGVKDEDIRIVYWFDN